jgi:3-oxoacyl-[acyl-carrier protein] reductase
MNLGIQGKRALICASSSGLGFACASALAAEGVQVVLNSRTQSTLDAAVATINAAHPNSARGVCADINTSSGREALLAAAGEIDILVNNNAGPPPGKLEDWPEDVFLKGIEANMLAPVDMIRRVVRGMQARRFGRIINITSAMVKSPRSTQGLSTTARAGLTAFSKSLSLEVAKDGVTINNLLPERIATPRQTQLAERQARLRGITVAEATAEFAQSIAAKRMGTPEEFGAACAFLCSIQAAFICGQNLQLDGGSYPGLI